MILKGLKLDFFRNYVHLETDFDPRVNLIYGENAQGKTNLLEAIAYLSTARSHRARYDREMILLGVDEAFVKAEVASRSRDFTLEARLSRGKSRQLWSNGVRLKTAGELSPPKAVTEREKRRKIWTLIKSKFIPNSLSFRIC